MNALGLTQLMPERGCDSSSVSNVSDTFHRWLVSHPPLKAYEKPVARETPNFKLSLPVSSIVLGKLGLNSSGAAT